MIKIIKARPNLAARTMCLTAASLIVNIADQTGNGTALPAPAGEIRQTIHNITHAAIRNSGLPMAPASLESGSEAGSQARGPEIAAGSDHCCISSGDTTIGRMVGQDMGKGLISVVLGS